MMLDMPVNTALEQPKWFVAADTASGNRPWAIYSACVVSQPFYSFSRSAFRQEGVAISLSEVRAFLSADSTFSASGSVYLNGLMSLAARAAQGLPHPRAIELGDMAEHANTVNSTDKVPVHDWATSLAASVFKR